MFTVVTPDYTALMWYFVGLAVFLTLVVILSVTVYVKKKRKNKGQPKAEYTGYTLNQLLNRAISMLVFVVIGVLGLNIADNINDNTYTMNVSNTENALNDKYTGDFVIEAYSNRDRKLIHFSDLDNVEAEKVTVERKLGGNVYVYRLTFVDGQPDVVKVVTSDSVQYPSLTE